jgi:hypothetical protein
MDKPMPQIRIGYNIAAEHAGSDRQYVVDSQINLHSTATLILDDHKSNWFFSKQIAARSPETLRICRTFMRKDANGGWDGSLWEAPNGNSPTGFLDAPNYMNFLQGLGAPAGSIHQILCESAVHNERLRAKNKWLVSCIKEASARGMRLCVDNVQTVTEGYQADIDAGEYDELWRTLAQYPQHFYGIHEYAKGDLWSSTSGYNMASLTKASPIDTGFLSLGDAALKANYAAYPTEAHLGRCEIIARRCRLKGITIPRMVYTEIGWDDVRIAQKDAVDAINGRVAMGYPTMSQYWHIRYPQWGRAEAAYQQLRWLNRAMPDYVVGACLFGFDSSFENGNYHVESDELQRLLTAYADTLRSGSLPPPTIPPPPPQTAQEQRFAAIEARLTALELWRANHEGD